MPGRRALVIGSQCTTLPALSFLPHAAHDLLAALADPAVGACGPAELLIDPTVQELDAAIEQAVKAASEAEETLVIALIGHGEYVDEDFYVLARDSTCPANSARAYLLGQRIKEAVREYSMLDGLVVLIDTCHAGLGAAQAAEHWIRVVGAAGRRFEVLTATDERTAANGCFTRSLTAALRKGRPELGNRIRCADMKQILTECCPNQTAQHLAFDGHRTARYSDDASWLARNPARSSSDHLASAVIADLTRWYVPTPAFALLVKLQHLPLGLIEITGPAGSGKSALLAAISGATDRPCQATVFPAANDSPDDIARSLGRQLGIQGDVRTMAFLLVCLRTMTGSRIRIIIDSAPATDEIVEQLLTVKDVDIQVITVGSRQPSVMLDRAQPGELTQYFTKRGVSQEELASLIEAADGDWVVARAIADLACRGAV